MIEMREVSKALARRDRDAKAVLIKRRRHVGLTHAQMDRAIGMPGGWVRKIESYDSDPTLSDLRRYEALIILAEYTKPSVQEPERTISDGPRPPECCGVCPGIEGGGYDCTCPDNPRCPGVNHADGSL